MSFLPYPPTTTSEAIAIFNQDVPILHEVVHGGDTEEVLTENGLIPSVSKTIKDINDRIDASVKDTGWFNVGTFAAGFTYTAYNQVGRDADGVDWSYNGALPFTVTAGTVPSEPDYTNRGGSSRWVELAATDSSVLVGGVPAGEIAVQYNAFKTVDSFGAAADGTTNDSAAFASAASQGAIILSPNKTYFITELPNQAELRIIGNGATIRYDRQLIDRSFAMLDISDVKFDAQNSNLTRCIRVRKNSNIKFRKLNGYNIDSTTFVRMLDISTENVSIDIEDCYCENLVAAANGTVGDNNGACRFIYVGDEDATPLVLPSRGRIVNIRGVNLLPKEDGDMIHVQSSDAAVFDILIHDIQGDRVAKRLVKVQANGVWVSKVHADARQNPVAMYAVASHYGQFGSVDGVTGVGKFEQGVDAEYESTQVENVNITNTGAAVSQGSCLRGNAGLRGKNITGYGFEHVVGNYLSLHADGNTDIEGVYGQSTGTAVFVRAAVPSGRVEIEDIKAVTGASNRICQITRTSTNTFTLADIKDVNATANTFTGIDVTGAAVSKVSDIVINQLVSGNPVSINGGEAYVEDITGTGLSTDAVFLNATTKAVVTRARGGTSSQVLTLGCNNTIVNNAICSAGVPATRNTGTASTNTQTVDTLTFL